MTAEQAAIFTSGALVLLAHWCQFSSFFCASALFGSVTLTDRANATAKRVACTYITLHSSEARLNQRDSVTRRQIAHHPSISSARKACPAEPRRKRARQDVPHIKPRQLARPVGRRADPFDDRRRHAIIERDVVLAARHLHEDFIAEPP